MLLLEFLAEIRFDGLDYAIERIAVMARAQAILHSPELLVLLAGILAWLPALGCYHGYDGFFLVYGAATHTLAAPREFLSWIVQPHNEHIMPLTKIWYWIVVHLQGPHVILINSFNILFWTGMGAWMIRLGRILSLSRPAAICMGAFFLFSALPHEAVATLSSAIFMYALAANLLALELALFIQQARRPHFSLFALFCVCFAAPFVNLIGLLASLVTLLWVWMIAVPFFSRPETIVVRRSIAISTASTLAALAFLLCYLALGRNSAFHQAGLPGSSFLQVFSPVKATRLAFSAIVWRLGASFGAPGFSAVVTLSLFSSLLIAPRLISWKHFCFFTLWLLASLIYPYSFRVNNGTLERGPFYVNALAPWCGLLAIGVDGWRGILVRHSSWGKRIRIPAIVLFAGFLIASGATIWKQTFALNERVRPAKEMTLEFARIPDLYIAETGQHELRLPVTALNIESLTPQMHLPGLAAISFLHSGLRVEAIPAGQPFPQKFLDVIHHHHLSALSRALAPLPGVAN